MILNYPQMMSPSVFINVLSATESEADAVQQEVHSTCSRRPSYLRVPDILRGVNDVQLYGFLPWFVINLRHVLF